MKTYLIFCPLRTCFLSRGSRALQTRGQRSARGLAVPELLGVCGPGLGSLPGCPDSCSPRTNLPPPPAAWYRRGRWTAPCKKARWPRWGFLNSNNRPRCLNLIHLVFQPCARFPAPNRLPGSGRCRSWWVRDGLVWEEGSVRSVLAPSPSLWSKKDEKTQQDAFRGEQQQGQIVPKVNASNVSIVVQPFAQNPTCPCFSHRPLWTDQVLSAVCVKVWWAVEEMWRSVLLSARQNAVAAPSSSISLHISLAATGMTDWMLMGVCPRFGTISNIPHKHGVSFFLYIWQSMAASHLPRELVFDIVLFIEMKC